MPNSTTEKNTKRKRKWVPRCYRNTQHASVYYTLDHGYPLWAGWKGKWTRMKLSSYPDNVVHGVDVTVSHIHADGSDGKSIVLP